MIRNTDSRADGMLMTVPTRYLQPGDTLESIGGRVLRVDHDSETDLTTLTYVHFKHGEPRTDSVTYEPDWLQVVRRQTAAAAPKTAVRWLTERLIASANDRISDMIDRRAQEAVDRLYQMHSGPSGVCHCGSETERHSFFDGHIAIDVPIDKSLAIDATHA